MGTQCEDDSKGEAIVMKWFATWLQSTKATNEVGKKGDIRRNERRWVQRSTSWGYCSLQFLKDQEIAATCRGGEGTPIEPLIGIGGILVGNEIWPS